MRCRLEMDESKSPRDRPLQVILHVGVSPTNSRSPRRDPPPIWRPPRPQTAVPTFRVPGLFFPRPPFSSFFICAVSISRPERASATAPARPPSNVCTLAASRVPWTVAHTCRSSRGLGHLAVLNSSTGELASTFPDGPRPGHPRSQTIRHRETPPRSPAFCAIED